MCFCLEKLFSICIPTYNREKFLRNSLESLYRQLNNANREQVEVMVSNNCSTDGTHELVQEYIARGMHLTYFCNEKNLGADGNILQCIYRAQGKYVLVLGDDDLFLPGAVDTLLEILKQDDYGAVYISGRPYREQDKHAPEFAGVDIEKGLCNGINEYLQRVTVFITFLSGNIFNKALLPDFSAEEYKRSHLLQMPFFLYAAAAAQKNLYLMEKFLAVGGNAKNNGGYGLFTVFGENLFTILHEFKSQGITDVTIRKVADYTLLCWFPGIIMAMRKRDTFKPEKIDLLQRYHGDNWRYRYVVKPLYDMPMPVAKAFFFPLRCCRKLMSILGAK